MKIKSHIKLLTILSVLSLLSILFYIDFFDNTAIKMIFYIPFYIIEFVVLYFFYKGHNWARRTIIVFSATGLFSVFYVFVQPYFIFNFLLNVYFLIFLNSKKAKAYFHKEDNLETEKKSSVKEYFIWAAAIIFLIVSIFSGFLLIYFKNKFKAESICISDIQTGITEKIIPAGKNYMPKISPDMGKIAFICKEKIANYNHPVSLIKVVLLESKSIVPIIIDENNISSISWAEDSRSIYYSIVKDKESYLFNAGLFDGIKTIVYNEVIKTKFPVIFSPDGKNVVYFKKDRNLYCLSFNDKHEKKLTSKTNFLHKPLYPVWSPDSKKVLFLSFNSLIIIDMNTLNTDKINLIDLGIVNCTNIFFLRDNSDKVFFKARKNDGSNVFCIFEFSLGQKELKEIRDCGSFENNYDISSDGRYILYTKPD